MDAPLAASGGLVVRKLSATDQYAPLRGASFSGAGGEDDKGGEDPECVAFIPGTLSLTKTAIGSGVLGLPFALATTGWLVGGIVMLLTWLGSFAGQSMLFACAHRVGGKNTSWYVLAERTQPWMSFAVDAVIALKCVGVTVSYLIVIGGLMPQASATLFGSTADSALATKTFWITVAGFGLAAPLCCLKNLSALRFSSAFGLVTIIYVASLIVVFAVAHESTHACTASPCFVGISAWPESAFRLLESIPIFVFAFQCNTNVFMIFNEAPSAEPRLTVSRFVLPAHVTMLVIDALVAYAGFLLYGSNIKSNVLSGNFPADSIPVAIGRLCMSVAVAVSIPLQFFPARVCILNLCDAARKWWHRRKRSLSTSGDEAGLEELGLALSDAGTLKGNDLSTAMLLGGGDPSDPLNSPAAPSALTNAAADPNAARGTLYWTVTAVMFLTAYWIAYAVNSLGLVYELVGATAATMMSYTLPGLYVYALFPETAWLRRWGAAFAMFGLTVMVVSFVGIFAS